MTELNCAYQYFNILKQQISQINRQVTKVEDSVMLSLQNLMSGKNISSMRTLINQDQYDPNQNLIRRTQSVTSIQNLNKSEQKLNDTFMGMKKFQLRNIFVNKLRRRSTLIAPKQIQLKEKQKGICGIIIPTIQYTENQVRFFIFMNLFVILVQLVLEVFQGFIPGFKQAASYPAIITVKVICLAGQFACFFFKCTNNSFATGKMTKQGHKVILRYFKSGRLLLDIACMTLLILSITLRDVIGIDLAYFAVLILVLVFSMSDLTKLQTGYFRSKKAMLTWGLVKVLFSNILVAHIIAGIVLAMSFMEPTQNWQTRVGIQSADWWVRYFFAFYWGTTMMMTVGFGDMLPGNEREVIITALIQMFSCIVLGYNISYIGSLVSQLQQREQVVNRKVAIFQGMVKSSYRKTRISSKLQNKIYKYIQQLSSRDNNLEFQQRKELLDQLPQNLRKAYYKQYNQQIFPTVAFFNQLKPSTMQNLATKFQNNFYYHGQSLSNNICILEFGQVGYAYKKRGSSINGYSFDSLAVRKYKPAKLITPQFLSLYKIRNFDLVAKRDAIVWQITQQDFEQAIAKSVIDYQHYFNVLHKHSLDQDQWNGKLCQRCSTPMMKLYHTVYQCPRICYLPLKQNSVTRNVIIVGEEQCKRRMFNRNRSTFMKNSSHVNKSAIADLLKKLNAKKKIAISISQSRATIQEYQVDEDRIKKMLRSDKIVNFDQEQMLQLIQKAIKKYDTGYRDEFWEIQTDNVANYSFYFPNFNANRLVQTRMSELDFRSKKLIRTLKQISPKKRAQNYVIQQQQ